MTTTILIVMTVGCWTGCWSSSADPVATPSVRPAEIVGSSMAPHFLGDHYRSQCPTCAFEFVAAIIEPDQADPTKPIQSCCPNCGHAEVLDPGNLKLTPRDRANIRMLEGISDRPFQRWSVLAVQDPEFNQPSIKRLIGLPGESVRFADGNLFISTDDGETWKLLPKPFAVQKELAILIHDSQFSDGDPRWIESSPRTQPTRWFTFLPKRCIVRQGNADLNDSGPIEDYYASNHSRSRQLNPTDEILVELELEAAMTEANPTAGVWLEFDLRGIRYRVEFKFNQRRVRVTSGSDQKPMEFPIEAEAFSSAQRSIEASVIDRQLTLRFNGVSIISQSIEVGGGGVSSSPVRVGLAGDFQSWVKRARVYRDLFYFPAPLKADANGQFVQTPLVAGDGYLLIGDNVPVSFDSRFWNPPSIPKNKIIGVVEPNLPGPSD